MPKDPIIDDDKLFDILENAAKWEERRKATDFPWQFVSEDREKVHDALTALYQAKKLPQPRFNWAPSPYSMFGAMQYLRQMQIGQRQQVIKGLVKGDDPLQAHVRATFLEGIIERDITVSMGACLRDSLLPKTGAGLKPVRQLADILASRFVSPGNQTRIAGWKDWALYPVDCAFSYALQSQTICFAPFAKCVWISRPPTTLNTDDEGNLHCDDGPAARFEDGFEVWHKHVKEEPKLLEGEYLDELPSGEVLGLPAPKEEDE